MIKGMFKIILLILLKWLWEEKYEKINNLVPSADDAPLFRVTKSGVAQADANYDYATFYHKSDTSSQILSGTNGTGRDIMATLDNASGHAAYAYFSKKNNFKKLKS